MPISDVDLLYGDLTLFLYYLAGNSYLLSQSPNGVLLWLLNGPVNTSLPGSGVSTFPLEESSLGYRLVFSCCSAAMRCVLDWTATPPRQPFLRKHTGSIIVFSL